VLVQPPVIDTEVVRDLVDDSDADLFADVAGRRADRQDRVAVDRDRVRQKAPVLAGALG
jgi:hypothetical protein